MRDVSVGLPPRFRQPPQRKPGSAAGGRSTLAPLARQASGGEAKLGAPSAHHPSGSAPEGKFLLGEQALGVPAIGFPTRAAGRRAAVNAAATVGHGGGLAGGAPPGLCSAPGGRVQGGDVALIAESRLRRDERDHRALHRVDSRCCMGVRGGGVFVRVDRHRVTAHSNMPSARASSAEPAAWPMERKAAISSPAEALGWPVMARIHRPDGAAS